MFLKTAAAEINCQGARPQASWDLRALQAAGLLLDCWDEEGEALPGRGPGSQRPPLGALLHQPPGQDCRYVGSTQTFLLTRQLQVTLHLQNNDLGIPTGNKGEEFSSLSNKDRNLGLEGHPELFAPPQGSTASKWAQRGL